MPDDQPPRREPRDTRVAPADLRGRWQTLQLLAPVFELLNRAGPRAGFDHRSYDLAQLALRLIDYVVTRQASLQGSVTPASALDHLTQTARRMHPGDPAKPWAKVAKTVFATILNGGRPHEALWVQPADDSDLHAGTEAAVTARTQPYRYRLLRMVDGDAGTAVTATDEAVVLYLQALDTDLADRALALKLMVQIQMQAGAFDKALDSARQATRTARGLSASLRERLADTRRDVAAVDWHTEMPTWLRAVLDQVAQQLERDRQLLDLATQAETDPAAAAACRKIVAEVKAGAEVWIALERYLQQAIPVFLEAQRSQRLRPRGIGAAINLARDAFEPALRAPDDRFAEVARRLIGGIAAPAAPVSWGLGEISDVLLRVPVSYERRDPEVDEPGELAEPIRDAIPDDVAAEVADLLALAADTPTRLSELLDAARTRAAHVSDPPWLLDVLWGAALWVYVSGGDQPGDERPQRADLAAAVAALAAADTGQPLTDDRFSGPDLLLASPAALAASDTHSGAA